MGDRVTVDHGAMLFSQGGNLEIGEDGYVGAGAVLYGSGGVRIGRDALIAANVVIAPRNHVFADPHVPIRTQGLSPGGIVIGDDVWIGAGAIVLSGATIGSGSVIGAGSLVRGAIPAGVLAVGTPAVVKRSRA